MSSSDEKLSQWLEEHQKMVRDLHLIRDLFRGLVDDMSERVTRLEHQAEARAKSRQAKNR